MQEEFRFTTALRRHGRDVIRADVRYVCGGNPAPYFSITGALYDRSSRRGEETVRFKGETHWMHSCGCIHEDIAKAFPELRPFIKWHLTGRDAPMHYVANGIHWHNIWTAFVAGPPWDGSELDEHARRYGYADGRCYPSKTDTLEKSREYFASTIIYGALESDALTSLDAIEVMDSAQLKAWLEDRLPALQSAFLADVAKVRELKPLLTEET